MSTVSIQVFGMNLCSSDFIRGTNFFFVSFVPFVDKNS